MKKKKDKAVVPVPDKQALQPTDWTHGQCPIHFSTKKDKNGKKETHALVKPDHGMTLKEVLRPITGTKNLDLAANIFDQTVGAIKKNDDDSQALNLIAQFLSECNSKDAIEAFLLNQILAFQELGMRALGKMEKADMMVHSEYHMKTASKLFHLQHSSIDKLVKYKSGGEQKVVVQHVNVENGGKAIVGNFDGIGGGV